MTLYLTPAFGPPPPAAGAVNPTYELPVMAAAVSKTVELLVEHGMKAHFDPTDVDVAGEILKQYAEDPIKAAKTMTTQKIANTTPVALRAIDHQLKQFSGTVVQDAAQVRTYVTNKLLEESDNPDARVRLKALELLGKISDVGLFADRKEVTVTHQTSDELRQALKEKLTRLVNPDEVQDAELVLGEDDTITADALDAAWDD